MSKTKIVPVEPTLAMDAAGETALGKHLNKAGYYGGHLAAYKAMLEAAPDDLMKNNLASGVVPARLAAPDELARLEHTLSEWFCDDVLEDFQLRGILTSTKKWSDVSGYASSMRVISLQWLVWTGRIERHPDNPNRVRLRENQHASKGL